MVTAMLQRHRVPFIPVSAGVYVFAKLVPDAKTWEEEAAVVQKMKEAGVLVSSGRAYHGQETEKGWARITFAVSQTTLREGIRRIEAVLAANQDKRGVKRPREEESGNEWARRAPDTIGPCATPS
jgi:aspartate/methionine/tyrosine aminotransferase